MDRLPKPSMEGFSKKVELRCFVADTLFEICSSENGRLPLLLCGDVRFLGPVLQEGSLGSEVSFGGLWPRLLSSLGRIDFFSGRGLERIFENIWGKMPGTALYRFSTPFRNRFFEGRLFFTGSSLLGGSRRQKCQTPSQKPEKFEKFKVLGSNYSSCQTISI
jgi:hypothetical protein